MTRARAPVVLGLLSDVVSKTSGITRGGWLSGRTLAPMLVCPMGVGGRGGGLERNHSLVA